MQKINNNKRLKYLYLKILRASKRPQAIWLLLAVTFAESIFLPLPAITVFTIVALAQHRNALWIAMLVTCSSTLGGFCGYAIGAFFWEHLGPSILSHGNVAQYFEHFRLLSQKYGAFAVIIAAVTPLPFKLATISSGIIGMNFIVFAFASFVGRLFYFFVPAILIFFMGSKAKHLLEKHFYIILLFIVIVITLIFLLMRYL